MTPTAPKVQPHGTSRGETTDIDVCVIGAGQAGLALGFHLRRLNQRAGARQVSFVLLDDRDTAGGAWVDGWDTLTLFSPAGYSSLAGWPMPAWTGPGNPSAQHVVEYLTAYETRYDLPVVRPQRVVNVAEVGEGTGRLEVSTEQGAKWAARVVVNATGTWDRPFWPILPGSASFAGTQLHAAGYRSASALPCDRVLVIGGGNSGAQIAADLLLRSAKEVTWCTRTPPRFLPDEVDGRALFEVATRAVSDRARGIDHAGVGGLGDIVVVPSVRRARDECGLRALAMPSALTQTGAVWPDGRASDFGAVIWCTGFRPALRHLHGLELGAHHGHPCTRKDSNLTVPGAAIAESDARVYFLGYGDWCAPASATLIGVNRPARETAAVIGDYLYPSRSPSATAQSSRLG